MREKMKILHDNVRTKLYGKSFQDLVTSTCRYAPAALKCYIGALDSCGVTMSRIMSLKEYSDAGRTIESFSTTTPRCADHIGCAANNVKTMLNEAAEVIKGLYVKLKGLCLDCARKEIAGHESIVCRRGHATLPTGTAASSTPSV